jgi:hypothetical protein
MARNLWDTYMAALSCIMTKGFMILKLNEKPKKKLISYNKIIIYV